MRQQVWNFFREEVSEFQAAIVLSTHYIYEASTSDKVAFLNNGKFMLEMAPKRVLQKMQKETLGEAFDELYSGNSSEEFSENEEDEIEEVYELPEKLVSPMLGILPIIQKEFRLMTRFYL